MIDDRDRGRLEDMLRYAREAIETLGGLDAESLAADRVRFHALSYVVGVVGEAASQVSSEGRALLPGIQWAGAIATRNRLVHAYRGIDLAILVATVREDFPPLIAELERALGEAAP